MSDCLFCRIIAGEVPSEKVHEDELVVAIFVVVFLAIHPFEDGNGRWARLLANIWLMQHGQPVTIWPATGLRETESPIRGEYIAAMKQADLRNYGPLIDLHKRFSE